MLTYRHDYRFLAIALIELIASTTHASIVIDSWNLVTGVAYTNGGDAHISTVVQNPFAGVYAASGPGPTTAQSTYNISWTTDNADFLIQGSHQAVGADPALLQVGSEGGIYFTTTTDVLLTVDAAYDYNLAGPNLFTRMIFQVYPESNDPVDPIFTAGPHDDTYTGYPASGTLRINGQAIVPAGQTYLLSYSQYMAAHGNTGAVGTGNGYVHFTFAPVPEPAAIVPLALTAILARRPRHRDRCHYRFRTLIRP